MPTAAPFTLTQAGRRCSSSGSSTEPVTLGRVAAPPAHTPIRTGPTPRRRCSASSSITRDRGRAAYLMLRCQEHTARHGPTNSRPDVGLPDQSFRVAMTAPRRSRQRAPQIPTVLEHPGIDLSLPASPLGGGGLMPIRECCPPPLDARLLPAPVAGYRPRPFLAGAVETSYLSLARASI